MTYMHALVNVAWRAHDKHIFQGTPDSSGIRLRCILAPHPHQAPLPNRVLGRKRSLGLAGNGAERPRVVVAVAVVAEEMADDGRRRAQRSSPSQTKRWVCCTKC